MKNAYISNLYDLDKTIAGGLLSGYTYPWEVLPDIKKIIEQLSEGLDKSEYETRGDGIFIHRSAKVFDSAYIDGPCIICEDAQVRHCAFIRGSAIVGRGAVVGNSTELKNVILFDGVQVPHYNYVGDSILGYKAHMGAGSITSNVKSDKSLVVIKDAFDGENIETHLKKVGAMLGDMAEIGCNSVLNPGTVIGRGSAVYPTSCVRGVVPPEYIFKNDGQMIRKM